MPPMCMYSSDDTGRAMPWHYVHYVTRAVGQVGLIIVEATAVEKRGRISESDLGLWDDNLVDGLTHSRRSEKTGCSYRYSVEPCRQKVHGAA